jgi:hypothetical protein
MTTVNKTYLNRIITDHLGFLACIREVLGSNFDRIPTTLTFMGFLSPCGQISRYIKLGRDRILPHHLPIVLQFDAI